MAISMANSTPRAPRNLSAISKIAASVPSRWERKNRCDRHFNAVVFTKTLPFPCVKKFVPILTPRRLLPFTAAELIDAHVRSLQPGHLTDVVSSDQHTVKPWFNGKLAFVPPVKDFADEGFALIGGRLDVLGGQNVAALVYARRKHIINVFVLPTKEPDTPIHPPGLRQGYQWRHWRHQGMEYCAVSDVSDSDLYELAQLLYQ